MPSAAAARACCSACRGELVEVIRDNGMRGASRAERLAWERSRRGQPAL